MADSGDIRRTNRSTEPVPMLRFSALLDDRLVSHRSGFVACDP